MPEAVPVRSTFVRLQTGVPAALYEPAESTDWARVAFVFMHPDANFISHVGCGELAKRGYRVLGVNTRFANMPGPTGGPYMYHEVLPDVTAAVQYLQSLPSVDTIILAGHSGGGPLFSAYQNLAENGAGAFKDPRLLMQGPESLDGLPPADALVLLDAHVGYGAQALLTLDASIVDEKTPAVRDPKLDMFEPQNGYDPAGTTYNRDFVSAYTSAQAARMARLVRHARDRIAVIDAGRGHYPDDEPMVIPGIGGTRLWSPDTSLFSHTRNEWKLLKGDGSESQQIVHSVRPASGKPIDQRGYDGALITSVRRFLATHAICSLSDYKITEDSLTGIDWDSSFTSAPRNLEGVTVPLLSLVMTGHYFLVPNETTFAHAASKDKEMAMVEGAVHFMTPCTAVEKTPGAFGDTLTTTFDYVDAWTKARF